jgi:hypothetical protein
VQRSGRRRHDRAVCPGWWRYRLSVDTVSRCETPSRPHPGTELWGVSVMARQCSRPACKQAAVYTLTYVYRDSTAVLGPLAAFVEPHCYDLCARHADRMTAPRGWDVVRLPAAPAEDEAKVEPDDLEALANAVREATTPRKPEEPTGQGIEVGRKGHLRVLRSAPAAPSDPSRLR